MHGDIARQNDDDGACLDALVLSDVQYVKMLVTVHRRRYPPKIANLLCISARRMSSHARTSAGRYLQVIYIADEEPDSVFVITAYELIGKAKRA